jgi:2-hydroxy-3-oxopropionate reductase
MATCLAAAGIDLRVWNRTPERRQPFLHLPGVEVASEASQAVRSAQAVILMPSTVSAVDDVLFSEDARGRSVADSLDPSSLVIVMSSIPVEATRTQAERLRQRGIRYIDAPVSGGEAGARAATLSIMAGGESQDVERARPLLQILGTMTHVGPLGSGQLAKLANQLIVGVTIGAVAEALLLAAAGGAEVGLVCRALQGGFADSAILRQHGQRMAERSFQPGAHATTQLKDLVTARHFADAHGLDLPFLSLAERLYQAMCVHGLGDLDHSALLLELEQRAGIRN